MKQTYTFMVALLAAALLASCLKKPENVDPYSNYYNQPPLGKDTVWATATSISLIDGHFDMALTDDKDGQSYSFEVDQDVDFGRCYLLNHQFFGPQSVLSAANDYDSLIITVSHPIPMNLAEVTMSDYNIKLTLGVKKVYIRINDATTIDFQAYSKSERAMFLQPDSASRAKGGIYAQNELYTNAGPEPGINFCTVKPIFQRRK